MSVHIRVTTFLLSCFFPLMALAQPPAPVVDYGGDVRVARLGQRCLDRIAAALRHAPIEALPRVQAAHRECEVVVRFSPEAGASLLQYHQATLRWLEQASAAELNPAPVGTTTSTEGPPRPPELDLQGHARAEHFAQRCLERLAQVPTHNPRFGQQQAETARSDCEGVGRYVEHAGGLTLRYQQAMVAWVEARVQHAERSRVAAFGAGRRVASLPFRIGRNWSSDADDVRVDRETGALLRAAQALAPEMEQADRSAVATLHRELSAIAAQVERTCAQIDEGLRERSVANAGYNEALILVTQMQVAAMLFPDDDVLGRAATWAQSFFAGLGGREGALEIHRQASEARAANTRFPAAVAHDRGVERQARVALESQGWNETIISMALLERDWHVERQAGRVVSRWRRAAIGVRLADRSCRYYDFTMTQPRTASGWGTAGRSSHSSFDIACANLPR